MTGSVRPTPPSPTSSFSTTYSRSSSWSRQISILEKQQTFDHQVHLIHLHYISFALSHDITFYSLISAPSKCFICLTFYSFQEPEPQLESLDTSLEEFDLDMLSTQVSAWSHFYKYLEFRVILKYGVQQSSPNMYFLIYGFSNEQSKDLKFCFFIMEPVSPQLLPIFFGKPAFNLTNTLIERCCRTSC